MTCRLPFAIAAIPHDGNLTFGIGRSTGGRTPVPSSTQSNGIPRGPSRPVGRSVLPTHTRLLRQHKGYGDYARHAPRRPHHLRLGWAWYWFDWARLAPTRQTPQRQRDVEPPARFAVETVAEQVLGALQPVRHGAIRQVESAGCRASVAADVVVDLERLDQLIAQTRVRQERPELAIDDRGRQVGVAQQQSFDAELGDVVDHPTPADPLGHA